MKLIPKTADNTNDDQGKKKDIKNPQDKLVSYYYYRALYVNLKIAN